MGRYSVSPGNQIPKRPRISDVEAAVQARAAEGLNIPEAPSSVTYDFESHTMPSEADLHGSLTAAQAETRLLKPVAAVADETPTAVFSGGTDLASKAKASQAVKASKPIAQEVAELKAPKVGDTPAKPLAGQGAKAIKVPKSVQQAGSISDSEVAAMKAAGKVKKAPPLSGPSFPQAGKRVMTSEGSVEPIVKPAGGPKPPVTGKMTAGDLFGEGAPSRVIPKMAAGDLFPKPATLAEKFSGSLMGKAAGKVGEVGLRAAKGLLSEFDPTAAYRGAKAAKAAKGLSGLSKVEEAVAVGRGVAHLGKGLVKGAIVQNAFNSGLTIGDTAQKEMETAGIEGEHQKRAGARYGLKVETDNPFKLAGKSFLNRASLGYYDPDVTPTVTEDPGLMSKYKARRAQEKKRK